LLLEDGTTDDIISDADVEIVDQSGMRGPFTGTEATGMPARTAWI
jgi:hypothetical protein